MSTRFLFLLAMLLFNHHIEVHAEEVKLEEKTDIVTPDIERSSHQDIHLVSTHQPRGSTFQGFWKKKFIWRPRWVKTWQEKKIYVAVWKRMWSPATVKEWVPIPKPPPGWVKPKLGQYFIKDHH